ncbi:MAG TPA: PH domain-containing protein [Candidatus Saccharimonadales bacterium]|nr:PH domain-containing protein [Candidatus Saccharimonadales bacterium]
MAGLIIDNVNKDDPAFLYLNLRPTEEIKFIVRHHWGGFLGTLGITFALGLFPILLYYAWSLVAGGTLATYHLLVIVSMSSFWLFLLTFLFGSWINFYYDIIIITSERMINIDQEGLLARKTSELSLAQIQNVSAEVDGFLHSLLGFGLLIVETAGEGTSDVIHPGLKGYFTIEDIPDPNRIARALLDLHRALAVADEKG